MKKKTNQNKQAATSKGSVAGTKVNPSWFEKVNAELLNMVHEAGRCQ